LVEIVNCGFRSYTTEKQSIEIIIESSEIRNSQSIKFSWSSIQRNQLNMKNSEIDIYEF